MCTSNEVEPLPQKAVDTRLRARRLSPKRMWTQDDMPTRCVRLSPKWRWHTRHVPARRLSPKGEWTQGDVPARRLSPKGRWTQGGVPARTLAPKEDGLGGPTSIGKGKIQFSRAQIIIKRMFNQKKNKKQKHYETKSFTYPLSPTHRYRRRT